MQFADRINDRLFYRSYERQQRPYLECRSRNTKLRETGVPLRFVMLATTEWKNDGLAGYLTLSRGLDRNDKLNV
jgi:hypothetical protein